MKSSCVGSSCSFFCNLIHKKVLGWRLTHSQPTPLQLQGCPQKQRAQPCPSMVAVSSCMSHLCPLFWPVGLDPPAGEIFCTFPLTVFHTKLTKHCLCTLPAVLSMRKGWSSSKRHRLWKSGLHSGHECLLESGENLHGLQRAGGRPIAWGVWTPGHLSTAPKASWLNSNTLTPEHLTKAEVSHSTSHPQPPHQHHNYNKNSRLLHATHRATPATLGSCLRHLHLPLIFRNKFLNAHTELQEKAPNNDFVTLFLNAAWNR